MRASPERPGRLTRLQSQRLWIPQVCRHVRCSFFSRGPRWPARPRLARQGAHHRRARLQPLAGAARRVGHPFVHRHGLRLFGVLAAAVQGHRHQRLASLPQRHGLAGGAGCERLRLEDLHDGVDLHPVLPVFGQLGRHLGRLAGARRAAQGRCGVGLLLVRRIGGGCAGGAAAPNVADVAGLGRDRRHRPGPGLHLAGVDTDQVVPGPPRPGHGHGDHGLWRRRHDRLAAGGGVDEGLRHAHRRWRVANLSGDGGDLFRLHDRWGVWLSHPTDRLETRRLDASTGADRQRHDHAAPRACATGVSHPAVLAGVGGAVHECQRRHRCAGHGQPDAAGGVRWRPDRGVEEVRRA